MGEDEVRGMSRCVYLLEVTEPGEPPRLLNTVCRTPDEADEERARCLRAAETHPRWYPAGATWRVVVFEERS